MYSVFHGSERQKLPQNSSQRGRFLLRRYVIYISGTCSCRTKLSLFKAVSRESSSVGFNQEAPEPCSAFQSFPLLSHSKAALAPRCNLLSTPSTKELLSSFAVSNTFLNYKILFFPKKNIKGPINPRLPRSQPTPKGERSITTAGVQLEKIKCTI